MEDSPTIQWYPGHMAKAKKLIKKNLDLVDVVIEVVDARIPQSSRNPDLKSLLAKKPGVIVLNKKDLADGAATKKWISYFASQGLGAVAVNGALKQGIKELIHMVKQSAEPVLAALEAKGRKRRAVRAMVVGIPNVGKSTVINAMADQVSAKTGNKPGITKGPQWIRVVEGLELLDTPGLLWPKFEDRATGLKLAITGAVSDLVYPVEDVARNLVHFLAEHDAGTLRERYKIGEVDPDPLKTLEAIGKKRGFLATGGVVKMDQTAVMLLQEFRNGKLGRFSLEEPMDNG
ncbi:ribosome biogenesis GTPase YlqF [Candidatus Formimonas warabiya]|uniref:Ribosome biogenesis GTPase A n=1 Tax=Formimonas warabiya TaxID=1761012 RepID=A0A3G1KQ78_FORW1|nr:ribosome biogenesis GTPase YlqF [Candidatus Formimonas warabiya]ATW24590.1 ribosome biogenesis GTPase YlqF [Candidatus Formimonas warabiya]